MAYLHSRLGGAPRGERWERQLVVVQPEIYITIIELLRLLFHIKKTGGL